MKDTNPRIEVLHRMRPGVATAQQVLDALDAVDPLRRPVAEDAVEAALDAMWPGSLNYSWGREEIDRMSRAIAAADRARGRSYVKWRKPEDWEAISASHIVLIKDDDPGIPVYSWVIPAGKLVPPCAIAWAEIPTGPVWSETTPTLGTSETNPPPAPTIGRTYPDATIRPGERRQYPWTPEMASLVHHMAITWLLAAPDRMISKLHADAITAAFPETP